jgi:hypothetical protein
MLRFNSTGRWKTFRHQGQFDFNHSDLHTALAEKCGSNMSLGSELRSTGGLGG